MFNIKDKHAQPVLVAEHMLREEGVGRSARPDSPLRNKD